MDATKIDLQYIYADAYSTRQDTSVYGNGAMQVSIYVSVNYNGQETGETVEQAVKQYVQQNVVIYSLNEGKNVDWVKSFNENEFNHDIDNSSRVRSQDGRPLEIGCRVLPDVRAPLFFTVPRGETGTHKWIAKLDGSQTDESAPVTVRAQRFTATVDSFEIKNIIVKDHATLRTLRYKAGAFPGSAPQRIAKPLNYKGFKFTGTGGNVWMSMMQHSGGHKAGGFLEYKSATANFASDEHYYYPSDYESIEVPDTDDTLYWTSNGWKDAQQFSAGDIEQAWSLGIPMILIAEEWLRFEWQGFAGVWSKYNFQFQNFKVQDNFGNIMILNINWDHGDYYGWWIVNQVQIENN